MSFYTKFLSNPLGNFFSNSLSNQNMVCENAKKRTRIFLFAGRFYVINLRSPYRLLLEVDITIPFMDKPQRTKKLKGDPLDWLPKCRNKKSS